MAVIPVLSGPELYKLFSDRNTLEAFLAQAGPWAPIGFMLLNVLQIIIAPLPGNIFGMAGGYVFGFALGFLLNVGSMLVGSMLVFQLSKWYGKPLVQRFVSPKTAAFLERLATRKGRRGIALIFLIPFLPDDALCFVAGLTPMNIRSFALLLLVFRTPGILVSTLTGAGLINLSIRGWTIVGTIGLILLYVGWTKGDKLQKRFLGFLDRYLSPAQKPHGD
ncbi:MAG: TVP38/TMEM64 family protein [Firmicutes bacterium]|nr:TVP38/TMEM64 family protein [Bacillota bacterium]